MTDPTQLVAEIEALAERLGRARSSVAGRFIGQEAVVDQVLAALVCGGHALLVGLPGLGKTLLVDTLATVMGLQSNRIQFTPDLMPADILGSEVLDSAADGSRAFRFIEGPVFCQLLMADEINRASPRTQSALLQAMQEREVTIAGQHRPLGRPFHVLATQNPIEQEGTYPLPEAQLDRFLLKIRIAYPSATEESSMVRQVTERSTGADLQVEQIKSLIQPATVVALQNCVAHVAIESRVLDYAVAIVRATRETPGLACGASPRGSIALVRAGRARALMQGRGYVVPDDIKAVALPALRHRVTPAAEAEIEGLTADHLLTALLDSVPAPRS